MSSPCSHELLRLWTKHLWLVSSLGWFIHEVQWPKSWVEPLYSSVRKALFTSHSSAAPVRWDISHKEILIRESVAAITPLISVLSSYSSVWPLHVHHVLPLSGHSASMLFPFHPALPSTVIILSPSNPSALQSLPQFPWSPSIFLSWIPSLWVSFSWVTTLGIYILQFSSQFYSVWYSRLIKGT